MPIRRSRLAPLLPLATALAVAACAGGAAEAPAPSAAPTPAAAPATTPGLSAAQRQRYVGSYSITTPDGERITFRVYEENGALRGQPGTEPALQLVHQGGDVFRTVGQYAYTVTFAVENGRATGFTARNDDGVLQGARTP